MTASVVVEHAERQFITKSTRHRWEVLRGDDVADPIFQASALGNTEALQSLLLQRQWSEIMFQEQLVIYGDSPRPANDEARDVFVGQMTNIERAVTLGAINGHAEVVSILLAFAGQHGKDPFSVMSIWAINYPILRGHAAVIDVLATAWPGLVSFDCHHERPPIYEAIRLRQTEVLDVLLKHGADPFWSHADLPPLICAAAKGSDPRMMQLLMERGVSIAGSYALHWAVRSSCQDNLRFLIEHGADVNEAARSGNTPMHAAADSEHLDVMTLLESLGGDPTARNNNGETPAEVLERAKEERLARIKARADGTD